MFFKSKLKEIEGEILRKRKEGVSDSESIGNSANVRKSKREADIAILESERNFILDRRNGWKSKILWNVLVAIIVAVVTTYIVTAFISGSG